MEENAQAQMELTQLGGVDEAKRFNETRIGAGSPFPLSGLCIRMQSLPMRHPSAK
jgi:hypothetical protein